MDCQPRGFCFLKLVFVGTARRWLMGNKPKKLPRLWQRCAEALHRWPLKWANKACCEVWNRYGQPWKSCKIHQKLSNCLRRWNLVPKQVTTRIWCKYGDKHDRILEKIFCSMLFNFINETLCEMNFLRPKEHILEAGRFQGLLSRGLWWFAFETALWCRVDVSDYLLKMVGW